MVWGESGGGAKTAAIYTMPDASMALSSRSTPSPMAWRPFSADKPLMCGGCRDETVFLSLLAPPDIFNIDEAGLRTALSSTYQGAELDQIIATFHQSRPDATPAQLCFAITTSPIWRDSIEIAEAKVAQRSAPVFMYQLVYNTRPWYGAPTSPLARRTRQTSTSSSPTPTRTSTPSSLPTNRRGGWQPGGT